MAGRLDVNIKGLRQLLTSAAVAEDINRRARAVAAAAGDGYVVDASTGRNRARASVYPGTHAARRTEAAQHRLLAALHAAR